MNKVVTKFVQASAVTKTTQGGLIIHSLVAISCSTGLPKIINIVGVKAKWTVLLRHSIYSLTKLLSYCMH